MTPTMPLTMSPSPLASAFPVSSLPEQPHQDDSRMQVDALEPSTAAIPIADDDEFSDFAPDPEELEIIDQLVLEARCATGLTARVAFRELSADEALRYCPVVRPPRSVRKALRTPYTASIPTSTSSTSVSAWLMLRRHCWSVKTF